MPERLITLEAWAAANYAEPPSIWTLRRWARDAKIYPLPEKQGRTYYVSPGARYVDNYNSGSLIGAISGPTSARQ